MSNEEINRKIAEYDGWICPQCQNTGKTGTPSFSDPRRIIKNRCTHRYRPNYAGDLNAIAEVERNLTPELQAIYGDSLAWTAQKEEIEFAKRIKLRRKTNNKLFMPNGHGWFAVATLTARQRCEVLLKTVAPKL